MRSRRRPACGPAAWSASRSSAAHRAGPSSAARRAHRRRAPRSRHDRCARSPADRSRPGDCGRRRAPSPGPASGFPGVGGLLARDPHQFPQADVERLTDVVEPGQRQRRAREDSFDRRFAQVNPLRELPIGDLADFMTRLRLLMIRAGIRPDFETACFASEYVRYQFTLPLNRY